jgi:hypothetical protein
MEEEMAYLMRSRIYLDREQCKFFEVSYEERGESLVVAADTVINSRDPYKGYDREHTDMLVSFSQRTLVLESAGHGWFTIMNVY